MCFGHKEGEIDTCYNDSGGPLVCLVNKKWTLVGIVSAGNECALKNAPGVYTRVSHPLFYDWLLTKI